MTTLDPALSFDAAAREYERSRPSYPESVVRWMTQGAHDVADVGAGTGKLTRVLAGLGLSVTAVEPLPAMRAALTAVLPDVTALEGTGEHLPLADASVDAVTFAQAWHWVDPAHALPETARVLRPGGRLALVWNLRDEDDPRGAALTAVLGGEDTVSGSTAQRDRDSNGMGDVIRAHGLDLGERFGPVEHRAEPWEQRLTVGGLVELAASRSYVIGLDDAARAERLALVRAHGEGVATDGLVAIPYVAHAFRARLA